MTKLTQEPIDNCIESTVICIESTVIIKLGNKTTACILTLKNGFEVIGTSACVNPAEYCEEIGAKFATQRAMDKVWELEGYRHQCDQHALNLLEKELSKPTSDCNDDLCTEETQACSNE